MNQGLSFDDLKSFLDSHHLLDENRLALIYFSTADCKEYGRLTASEFNRALQTLKIPNTNNLKAILRFREQQIDTDPNSIKALYRFAINLYSFGRNSLNTDVFLSIVISGVEDSGRLWRFGVHSAIGKFSGGEICEGDFQG